MLQAICIWWENSIAKWAKTNATSTTYTVKWFESTYNTIDQTYSLSNAVGYLNCLVYRWQTEKDLYSVRWPINVYRYIGRCKRVSCVSNRHNNVKGKNANLYANHIGKLLLNGLALAIFSVLWICERTWFLIVLIECC